MVTTQSDCQTRCQRTGNRRNCCLLQSCCFGLTDLRKGVQIIVAYSVVLSLFFISVSINNLVEWSNHMYKDDRYSIAVLVTGICSIVVYTFWMLFSAGLYKGLTDGNCLWLNIWRIYTYILTGLMIAYMANIGRYGKSIFADGLSGFTFVLTAVASAINHYCCVVIASQVCVMLRDRQLVQQGGGDNKVAMQQIVSGQPAAYGTTAPPPYDNYGQNQYGMAPPPPINYDEPKQSF